MLVFLPLLVWKFGVLMTGANGDIRMVIKGAPALFLFCLVQIGLHLGITLAAARFLGFSRRDALIASNANVGGELPSLVASFGLNSKG